METPVGWIFDPPPPYHLHRCPPTIVIRPENPKVHQQSGNREIKSNLWIFAFDLLLYRWSVNGADDPSLGANRLLRRRRPRLAHAQATDPEAPACRWHKANATMTTEEIGFQEAPLSSAAKTATRPLTVAGGRDLESVAMCKQRGRANRPQRIRRRDYYDKNRR